jgi:CBS domain-containing protein
MATSKSSTGKSSTSKASTGKKKAAYTESHNKGKYAEYKKSTGMVKDVMAHRVIAVTSVTFLPEAATIMKQEDVGALPVVQEDGKLMGIVTDRDITVRAVADGRNISQMQVAEVFTADDLVTVTPDMSLEDAEELMAEHQVRRLPVVEQGTNKLMGILAQADILHRAGKGGHDHAQVIADISKPGGEHSQQKEE